MRCSEVLPRLSDFDLKRPMEEAHAIEEHLQVCADCLAALDRLWAVSGLAAQSHKALPKAADPASFEGFSARVMERLGEAAPSPDAPSPFAQGDLFAQNPDSNPKVGGAAEAASGFAMP